MKRFKSTLAQFADNYLFYFLLAIVIIMPLHAFLVISLGRLVGHQVVLQAWKELGLVIAVVSAAVIYFTNKAVRSRIVRQPAAWTAAIFITIALIVSALTMDVPLQSLLLGIKTTLGFVVLFIVMQAAKFTYGRWNTLIKALLAISSAIGLFAVAQVYLLPADWLVRFGYGTSTVLPFHLVDPAVASIRIIATLSGPNQLGSFMIIPLIVSFWLVLRKRWLALVPFGLAGFALFHSYSRSAWIGAVVALFVVLFIRLKRWWKLTLLAPIAGLIVVASVLSGPVHTMTTNLTFYVYHGQFIDGHTNGSDSYRLKNAQYGLIKIEGQPQGYGLGTAGPASKNNTHPIITENSYLQIAIETGVIGLLLFIATIALTGWTLFKQAKIVDEAMALFAILIGLSATNLFLHTWADSATALVLWGLMGYCLVASKRSRA